MKYKRLIVDCLAISGAVAILVSGSLYIKNEVSKASEIQGLANEIQIKNCREKATQDITNRFGTQYSSNLIDLICRYQIENRKYTPESIVNEYNSIISEVYQ